jgi:hypothetical protein
MKLVVSRILSDVFNPLFNAVVAFVVIIATDPNNQGASKLLVVLWQLSLRQPCLYLPC